MVISLHKLIVYECVNDKWLSFLTIKIMIDYSSCEFQRYTAVIKIYSFCLLLSIKDEAVDALKKHGLGGW